MNVENGYMEYRPTRWGRLVRWLFPRRHIEFADPPEGFKGGLYVTTWACLDWRDRIRVVLTGKLRIDSRVWCQHEPGNTIMTGVLEVTTRVPRLPS